ncbi:MerR family transcriptional regulator [Collinsella intestinalis]|uniref:transcriptional regulator FtsR n=1 Tax=Collinsella intestinalis TaxID=147207 RepID=UPI001EF489D1|nr:MerR family transcriptional regulator [Collinsella intestinalis]
MAERSYLSIGQVVNYLRSSYPDLSNSKIRFLEDEGLITPHRTPKGYRQYSKEDVDRLEVILHLQKTRYMPLNVIKQRLDNATDLSTLAYEVGLLSDVPLKTEPRETQQKLHPIEDIPDLLGVKISFLRQLAENDLIKIVRSPKNRELIDGRDFPIIRYASELSRFNIEPRNLRQYVLAANRESTMFEQVLTGMLGSDTSEDNRNVKIERAFKKLHDLTDGIQAALLKNRVYESLNVVVNDADVDEIDEELDESEAKRAREAEATAAADAEDEGGSGDEAAGGNGASGASAGATSGTRKRSVKTSRSTPEVEPLPLPGLEPTRRRSGAK